jgi:hypothetical protein
MNYKDALTEMIQICDFAPEGGIQTFVDSFYGDAFEHFVFKITPTEFAEKYYATASTKITLSHILSDRSKLTTGRGTPIQEFENFVIDYFGFCAMPEAVSKHVFGKGNNCFSTKLESEDPAEIGSSPYNKIPTNIFGKKEIPMLQWAIPLNHNFFMVFLEEGLCVSTNRVLGPKTYQGWEGALKIPEIKPVKKPSRKTAK